MKINKKEGVVFNIERHALHDGPGIRTLVFLKGCPLRCNWCSNPEGFKVEPVLLFDKRKCTGCGKCAEVCPSGAISIENGKAKLHRENCTRCGKCVEVCPNDCYRISGTRMTVSQVMDIVQKDEVFYNGFEGGLTVSGGEPTMQYDFLYELLSEANKRGINTAIETCGYCDFDKFKRIVPLVNWFLFDVKHVDESKHKKATGVSNKKILKNLKYITDLGKKVIVRIPLIPDFNSDEKDIQEIAEFLAKLKGMEQIHILPYHRLGLPKYHELDMEYPMEKAEPLAVETAKQKAKIFSEYGLNARVEV